jgi:hypothetical protein
MWSKAGLPRTIAPDDTKLAWALAETARAHLTTSESNQIYIAIGIGESFAAIDVLLTAILREQLRLDAEVVGIVTAWLDCHIGQDAEPRLRNVVAAIDLHPSPTTALDARQALSPQPQSDSA